MKRILAILAALVFASTSGVARADVSIQAWNPPSNLVQPLNEVWQHVESTYGNLYGFRNYGWDQVMANGGYLNFCVRWDSSANVTAAQRDQIQAALVRQATKWMNMMLDNGQRWENWPYQTVPIKVVGWAVRNRSQLQWTDNSVDIYVNDINENAPQCSRNCGRFFHQDGNSVLAAWRGTTTSRCG
jgi:hypothetical protein